MAEKGGTRPDESRAEWSVTGTKTEYAGAKKTAGWVFEDIMPYDGENWRLNFYHTLFKYLCEALVRSFLLEMKTPINDSDVSVNDVFWVISDDYEPLEILESVTTYSPTSSFYLAADGWRVFLRDTGTTGRIVALEAADYTAFLWNSTPVTETIVAMETNGGYLFVGYSSAAGNTKGAMLQNSNGALQGSFTGPAANAVLSTAFSHNYAWCTIGSELQRRNIPTLSGLVPIGLGGIAKRVAADHDKVFATNEGSPDTQCFSEAGSLLWSRTLVTGGAGPGNLGLLAADGEFVYVADYPGLWAITPFPSAAIPVNIWCLSRQNGNTVWAREISTDHLSLSHDEKYLYLVVTGNQLYCLDKRTGAVIYLADATHQYENSVSDGPFVHVSVDLGGTTPAIARLFASKHTLPVQKVRSTTYMRKPFRKLALPLSPGK